MPALATDPRDRRTLLGVAKLLRGGTTVPFTFSSADDGATWHDNGPLPLPAGYDHGSSDATVTFTATGTGIVAAAAWGPTSGAIFVWRTTDGGRSFTAPVAVGALAYAPWALGSLPHSAPDQPHLAADATGAVYLIFARLDPDGRAFITRSLDQGRSFAPPQVVAGALARAIVTAAGAGMVDLIYGSQQLAGPRLAVRRSTDQGRTFGPPQVIPWVPAITPPAAVPWIQWWPSAAIDPKDDILYVTFSRLRPGTQDLDVVLTRSRDGGRTWDAPVELGTDPLGPQAERFQAQLALAPDGTVYVSYDVLVQGRVAVYLARSTDHGASIGPSQQITSVSFTPALGSGEPWIGDYQGLAVGAQAVHPVWTDTRTGHLELFTASLPLMEVPA